MAMKGSSNDAFQLSKSEENFHRFWEPAPQNSPSEVLTQSDDDLEQVLCTYESNVNGKKSTNYRWQSVVTSEKPSHPSAQTTGVVPATYKRSYTLFPRPGYRESKFCCCGPKPTIMIVVFLLLLILLAIMVYFLTLPTNEAIVIPNYNVTADVDLQITKNQTDAPATTSSSLGTSRQGHSTITERIRPKFEHGTTKSVQHELHNKPDSTFPKPHPIFQKPAGAMVVQPPPAPIAIPTPAAVIMMDYKKTTRRTTKTSRSTSSTKTTRSTTKLSLNSLALIGCFPSQCHPNAVCTKSGFCRCREGFEGDGVLVCANIDECIRRRGICGCNAKCVDTLGSYQCFCKKGYVKEKKTDKCVDLDECKLRISPCPFGSRCVNVSGGFRCLCPSGTQLDDDAASCQEQ